MSHTAAKVYAQEPRWAEDIIVRCIPHRSGPAILPSRSLSCPARVGFRLSSVRRLLLTATHCYSLLTTHTSLLAPALRHCPPQRLPRILAYPAYQHDTASALHLVCVQQSVFNLPFLFGYSAPR